ncbi:hypothetical protein [Sphingobium subterraneum]|uniref:Uncharacterized protein n=1 Tax=Sphingobium subterraneum TaxID=627688 RepID=A0A841IZN5_9SPHN|nr:hypothetical protein [Sphingobium subterraneum]MBB6124123.1 hypothetical protein [Sphingobium subterraneum]
MSESAVWSVDRVAAEGLLRHLKLDVSEANVALVATHFAEHRHAAHSWAAERVCSGMFQSMESYSVTTFGHHGPEWSDGFRAAEQYVLSLHPRELLDTEPPPPRTKGQILRGMVRQARRDAARP